MQIQKAITSPKTFIYLYVMQSSYFPSLSSALPERCTVHMAFLHCTEFASQPQAQPPELPPPESSAISLDPLPTTFPSVLLSDSHEQFGLGLCFSFTTQVSDAFLSHPQNYTDTCAKYFAL